MEFECNRFDFDFEICIKLLRKGYRPDEILINYHSRGFDDGKKVSFFRDPPTWIKAMLKLRRGDALSLRRFDGDPARDDLEWPVLEFLRDDLTK